MKTLLIGNSCVSKTTLINMFTSYQVLEEGIDCWTNSILVEYLGHRGIWGVKCTWICLLSWNTSCGCGLLFDLSNPASFNKLDSCKKNFLNNAVPAEPEKFPFILISNKTYLDRKVSPDQVAAWRANNDNIPYLETNAIAKIKVEDAFR